jgi:lipopolysaccharide/colanic/teichoic acid biosynthesis glycosyltransferase
MQRSLNSFVKSIQVGPSLSRAAIVVLQDLVAALALVVVVPIWLVLALPIALTTRSSPFFFQWRLGKDQKPFRLIKLRTMTKADGHALLDTPTGHQVPSGSLLASFLRRTRLDESPQLLNVLAHEMNIVGPRPMINQQSPLDACCGSLRWLVKPGMVGLSEVSGNTNLTQFEDELVTRLFMQKGVRYWAPIILTRLPTVLWQGSRRREEIILQATNHHLIHCIQLN